MKQHIIKKHITHLLGIGVMAMAFSSVQAASALEKNLASIYDNVLIQDAGESEQACQAFAKDLKNTPAGASNNAIRKPFTRLLSAWKKVEANYIGAEIDSEAIDWPRYLDIFHIGNEDIRKQMKRAVASDSEPDVALFKNSFRTLNALEALLFEDNTLNERELLLASTISQGVCQRLGDIKQMYVKNRSDFLAQPDKAAALFTNALATSSFMLKDWRVGDPAGFTKKYENRPDAQRSEYALSDNSMAAVHAILTAQDEMIGKQKYANFADIAQGYGADKQIAQSRQLLAKAQKEAKAVDRAHFDFNPKETKPLYDTLGKLHNSYYASLVQALPIVGKILEADGD